MVPQGLFATTVPGLPIKLMYMCYLQHVALQVVYPWESVSEIQSIKGTCGWLIAVDTKAAGLKHMHFATYKWHMRSGVWCSTEAPDGKR